jgi:hypothetical protein
MIADRHPVLGRLYRVWLARREGAAMPQAENITERLADLDDVIVVIRRPADSSRMVKIERSGKAVDRIYGIALTGESVGRLTPSRDDAENEAAVVFASGRTLMMEDQVQLSCGLTRVARLYLPFADAAGWVVGIVIGIVRVV